MFFLISLSLPLSLLLLSILFLIYGIKTILLPPSKLTRPNPQIQVIPMWVSISPLFRRILRLPMLGQDEHFKRYIQPRMKNGAAWIFFASRWNLLVADPASIHRLLSTETRRNPGQGFHKVGNHLKIPQAVISQLTGSNIISEYGETWEKYRKVIASPLSSIYDSEKVQKEVVQLLDSLLSNQGQPLMITPWIQRFSMQCLCMCAFRKDLKFMSDKPPKLHHIHTSVKRHVFDPFFLSFPFLDNQPWCRLFPSRMVAREAVLSFEVELIEAIGVEATTTKRLEDESPLLANMTEAVSEGIWTQRQLIDNLKIIFIAGHENVQQALISLLYVLALYPEEQSRLRIDLLNEIDPSLPSNSIPQIKSFILETLRLYPPIPQLLNRRTDQDQSLSLRNGIVAHVPAGTFVGWTAFAAQRTVSHHFKPQRWGSTLAEIDSKLRNASSKGEFVAFHSGLRACLGQRYAMFILGSFLQSFLLQMEVHLPDGVDECKLTAGGLLAPFELSLVFKRVESKATERL